MAVSFVGWGISGDLFRLMGPPSWVAKVGGQTIEIPAFQTEYQRAMAQRTRDLPSGQEASPSTAASGRAADAGADDCPGGAGAGVEGPSRSSRRTKPWSPPRSRCRPSRVPTANSARRCSTTSCATTVSPRRAFWRSLRGRHRAAAGPVHAQRFGRRAGCRGEAAICRPEFEKRAADMALFPVLGSAGASGTPTKPSCSAGMTTTPTATAPPNSAGSRRSSCRRSRLSSEITITDDELHAAYEEHKAEYVTPEKRSAEVISAPDEAKARTLGGQMARWHGLGRHAGGGAGRGGVRYSPGRRHASAVSRPRPGEGGVLDAPPIRFREPVKGQLGWFVVKVTKIDRRNDHDVRSGEGQAAGTGAGQQGGRSDV